jgi:hypothetical protein
LQDAVSFSERCLLPVEKFTLCTKGRQYLLREYLKSGDILKSIASLLGGATER